MVALKTQVLLALAAAHTVSAAALPEPGKDVVVVENFDKHVERPYVPEPCPSKSYREGGDRVEKVFKHEQFKERLPPVHKTIIDQKEEEFRHGGRTNKIVASEFTERPVRKVIIDKKKEAIFGDKIYKHGYHPEHRPYHEKSVEIDVEEESRPYLKHKPSKRPGRWLGRRDDENNAVVSDLLQ
jgi:hypothetical protein